LSKTYNLDFELPWPSLACYYEEFLATRIEELVLIKAALEARDYKEILEFTHKWRGFANPYGFGILGQQAIELEEYLELSNIEQCKTLLDEMEIYLTITKKTPPIPEGS
jgi:hypothetical protein